MRDRIYKDFENTDPTDSDKLQDLRYQLHAIQRLVNEIDRVVRKAKAHRLVEKANE